MSLNDYRDEVHDYAKDKGWWDDERSFGELVVLCHSELSEAIEHYRNGYNVDDTWFIEDGKPDGVPTELADTIIRIFDICGAYDIDLEQIYQLKMDYNKRRDYRHGDKEI